MQIAFIEFLYRDHIMLDYLVKFKNDFFELVYASRVREDFLSWDAIQRKWYLSFYIKAYITIILDHETLLKLPYLPLRKNH